MGSIQKILSSLKKISEDKKSQITQRYEEEVQWLANELELVRKLILKNPQGSDTINSNEKTNVVTKVASIMVPISSTSSSTEIIDSNAEFLRQKRKSPEMAQHPTSFSPVLKKNSAEVDPILVDLNKLRKDQLLEELDKLGIKHFTMKTLKKDLVDALRLAITNKPNSLMKIQETVGNKPIMSPASKSGIASESQDINKSTRKHSLLDEIRVLVSSSDQSKLEDESKDEKAKTEIEFEARQKRHRDSQLRMSQGTIIKVDSEMESNPVTTSNITTSSSSSILPSTTVALKDQQDTMESPMKGSNVDDIKDGIQSPMNQSATWMDVASPQNIRKEEREDEGEGGEEGEEEEEMGNIQEEGEEVNSNPMETTSRLSDESDSSSIVSTQSSTITTTSSSSTTTIGTETTGKFVQNNNSTVLPVKKPTNLLSTQSSFLDKPQAAKPVVQSLVMAKQAKLAEEKKIQQKKLEQDAKLTKPSVPTQVQKNPTAFPTKPLMTSTKQDSSKSNIVTQPSSAVVPPTKKPGILSSFLGKKPVITTATAAPVKPDMMQSTPPESVKTMMESQEKVVVAGTDTGLNDKEVDRVMIEPSTPPLVMEAAKISAPVVPQPMKQTTLVAQPPPQQQQLQLQPKNTSPSHSQDENMNPNDNYEFDDDDSSEGSGTDDEAEASNTKEEKQIPEWARGSKLKEALERQLGIDGSIPMDPDMIFPEVQSCNLEEIFGSRGGISRLYSKRTSSAHWEQDSLTVVEKRTYRNQMGYTASLY